ncbi:hypothetical protein EVAR_59261_1 [Eumeta japonica]|uniref:Uncharacterized protein n=1 Tax=Eumeta variegata TaxID=151549 RepID=A0A4C1YJE9_EUMVA|nr:hypothetical protein EVAR_59261_1 [Eumeta japonica]
MNRHHNRIGTNDRHARDRPRRGGTERQSERARGWARATGTARAVNAPILTRHSSNNSAQEITSSLYYRRAHERRPPPAAREDELTPHTAD